MQRAEEIKSPILRILTILEEMVAAGRPVTATEINRELGLPKATIHRLCGTLAEEGFLKHGLDGKRFLIGPRLRNLAVDVFSAGGEDAHIHTVLRNLSQAVDETVNIAIADGDRMLYLDRIESQWPLRMQLPVGSRVPLHNTASGKLFLACLPAARRRRLIGKLALERTAPNTITDRAALEAAMERIAATKVGTDDQEFVEGMVCVAVPIRNKRGRFVGAMAVHAPMNRMDMTRALSHVPRMRAAASELSAVWTGDMDS
ncbi:MAG: IclR family transcriptional regulator [Hyphomicrobiales bacterium]|nr:IclR family transcriptional regulator [Hyphomicrobiales bacterium]